MARRTHEKAGMVTVRVDDENNSEAWWDAVRTAAPSIAEALSRDSEARISRDAYAAIRALPGWDDDEAPEYAPHPLTEAPHAAR